MTQDRGRGRPEDPLLRERVLRAAIACYSELGWSGFNFEAVATRASVGRPALYRRWEDRGQLLAEAFQFTTSGLVDQDLGSLHLELMHLAHEYLATMTGERGLAGTRLMADSQSHPELFQWLNDEILTARRTLIEKAVARARARGEITAEVTPDDVWLLLFGALWTSTVTGAPVSPERVERIIDIVLQSVNHRSSNDGEVRDAAPSESNSLP